MNDPKKKEGATIVPDTLPDGFPSVKPHVNEKAYRYTLTLRNGNYYPVTSDAKSVKELFSRIITPPGTDDAVKKTLLDYTIVSSSDGEMQYLHFPEATIGIGTGEQSIEAIVADWPPEEEELDEEEDDEEEDDLPRRKKPKKPW